MLFDKRKSGVSKEGNVSADVKSCLIRRDLTLIITGLVAIIALLAAYQNGAMPVLDKLFPLATLAFGFYFGNRANRL